MLYKATRVHDMLQRCKVDKKCKGSAECAAEEAGGFLF